MKTRDGVIQYQKVLTDTETLIQDINIPDPISAFWIEVWCTNGATSNKGNFISDIITKVEVVDGSDVLISLNMAQLEALHFYKAGKTPVLFPSEWGGGTQRNGVYLLFGRYLWDPMFCFVPTKYRNPQIKITANKAAIRAAAADGFASGNNILVTIVAKIFEEGASPVGHLMQKQINSFVSAASGDIRIELPTDYVYRMLMPRFWKQQSDINEIITDLKLTCDTDKFIPFNRKVRDLDSEALTLFGRSVFKHDVFVAHQIAFRELNNKENSSTAQLWENTSGNIIGIQYEWSSEGKLTIITNGGAVVSSDQKVTMLENGHSPHATLPIPFGRFMEPDTWFDPKTYGKVELVMTQAVASAVCEIVLEQVRP